MTKRQTLQLEQSEKRQRLNELLGIDPDKLTDEQRSEMETLTKRMQQIEVEMRAAIVAEGEEESRAAELFEDNGETAECWRRHKSARIRCSFAVGRCRPLMLTINPSAV